jgi:hypothetical protein
MALLATAALTDAPAQPMIAHDYSGAPAAFSERDPQYLEPSLVETRVLQVRAMQIDGFSGEARRKLEEAFRVLEAAVNTEEFKERVLNFKNKKGERAFASNRGLSNEEIYDRFMEGRETLQPETAGEMNFYLKLYDRPWSRVIGWTTADTNTININWRFFRNYTPADVAANLAHEWTHKIGFDHRSAKEHDSAPYAIGYIAGDIAKKLLAKPVEAKSLRE